MSSNRTMDGDGGLEEGQLTVGFGPPAAVEREDVVQELSDLPCRSELDQGLERLVDLG